jgi:hypothetical protein
MTKTLFALVLAGTLAGCSLFSKPSNDYSRPSGTEDQTSADLNSCRQQADAMINRDANIDSDIAAARSNNIGTESTFGTLLPGSNEPQALGGATEFEREQRYHRIINDCMRQRGYVLPEKNPLF